MTPGVMLAALLNRGAALVPELAKDSQVTPDTVRRWLRGYERREMVQALEVPKVTGQKLWLITDAGRKQVVALERNARAREEERKRWS